MNININSSNSSPFLAAKRSLIDRATIGLVENPFSIRMLLLPTENILTIYALLEVLFREFIQTILGKRQSQILESQLKGVLPVITFNRLKELKKSGIFQNIVDYAVETKNDFKSNDLNALRTYLDDHLKTNEVVVVVNKDIKADPEAETIGEDCVMWFGLVIEKDMILFCDLKDDHFVLMNRNDFIRKILKVTNPKNQTYLMHHNDASVAKLNNPDFIARAKTLLEQETVLDAIIDEFADM